VNKLKGCTILNTRPLEQAIPLAESIEKEGGRCLLLPSFSVTPTSVLSEVSFSDYLNSDIWLFMSQYAVKFSLPELLKLKDRKFPYIGAVGKSTAMALESVGLEVKWIPESGENTSSEGLLSLRDFQVICGKKITVFQGKSGRKLVDEILLQRGAVVQECILYERVAPDWSKTEYAIVQKYLQTSRIDQALGMSVDSLKYFFSQIKPIDRRDFLNIPWLVMSSRVADYAKALGIQTISVVKDSDILESLILCYSSDIIRAKN
jgi:uroporphyrinogen-III synthase